MSKVRDYDKFFSDFGAKWLKKHPESEQTTTVQSDSPDLSDSTAATQKFTDRENERNSKFAIPAESLNKDGLHKLSQASELDQIKRAFGGQSARINPTPETATIPKVITPEAVRNYSISDYMRQPIEKPIDRVAGVTMDAVKAPFQQLREGQNEWANNQLNESVADIGLGALNATTLPFTAPFSAIRQILKETGKPAEEVGKGLEQTVDIPFGAIRSGSAWTQKGLEALGIDTDKLDKFLGISPELDKKINDLATMAGGFYLMGKGHGIARDLGAKTIPESIKGGVKPETKPETQPETRAEGIEKIKSMLSEQKEEPNKPDTRPAVEASTDPKSRLIVNDLEKFVNDAVKRGKKINEASITSQLDNIIDPKEKLRLEQLYTTALDHNKNLIKEASNEKGSKPLGNESTGQSGGLNETGPSGEEPEIKSNPEAQNDKQNAIGEIKQPYEMMQDEYLKSKKAKDNTVLRYHLKAIKQALEEGKDVPENVINEYPKGAFDDVKGKTLTPRQQEAERLKKLLNPEKKNSLISEPTTEGNAADHFKKQQEIYNKNAAAIDEHAKTNDVIDLKDEDGFRYVMAKSTKEPGKYQITEFNYKGEPNSDRTFDTKAEAIEEMKRANGEIQKPEKPTAEGVANQSENSELSDVKPEKGAGAPSTENKPQTPEGKKETWQKTWSEFFRDKYPEEVDASNNFAKNNNYQLAGETNFEEELNKKGGKVISIEPVPIEPEMGVNKKGRLDNKLYVDLTGRLYKVKYEFNGKIKQAYLRAGQEASDSYSNEWFITDKDLSHNEILEHLVKLRTAQMDLINRVIALPKYDLMKEHKNSVEQALKEGQKVPPEVLENYPELKPFDQSSAPEEGAQIPPAESSANKSEIPTGSKSTLNLRGSKDLSDNTKKLIAENDKQLNDLFNQRGTNRNGTPNEKRAALRKIGKIAQSLRAKGLHVEYRDKNVRIDGKVVTPFEKSENVNVKDVKIENPKSEKSFEELPKSEVEKQTALAQIVEPSDLDKGLGKKVIDKGVQDIKDDNGKEQSPEAKAVRDAALQKEKDGVKVGGETLKGDELVEAIKSGKSSDLAKAKASYESLKDDVFATTEEIEAARKKVEDLEKVVPKPKVKAPPEESLFKGTEDNKPVMRTDKGLHEGEAKTNEEGTPLFEQKKEDKGQEDIFEKSKNKIFTDEAYKTAHKNLITFGAYHIENGVRDFAEFSQKMIDEIGEAIKPHLKDIWDGIKDSHEDLFDREADKGNGKTFASHAPDQTGKDFKTSRKDDISKPERPPVDLRKKETSKETMLKAASNFARGVDGVKKMFAPASRGEEARMTAAVVREKAAKLAHERELMAESVKELNKHFDKQDPYYNIDIIDGAERGELRGTPEEKANMRLMQKVLNDKYKQIQSMKNGASSFIENYFPHIWKDPEKASEVLGQVYSKKPLEGTRSFQKQRSIPFTKDGIALGLEPVSTNPVELFLAKNHEMDRYIMAHDIFNDMKGRGLAVFHRIGEKAPQGWTKINDRIATAFGNPNIEVQEAYDKHIMDGLNKVAKGLGIDLERKTKIGGSRWGYANELGEVVTKFGGPESVLAHEIGHQLDFKYGLKDQLVNNPEFKKELRALADLRYEGAEGVEDSFKKYVRKDEEKMAVMLESYIHAPEKFKESAPKTYKFFTDFLKSKPELKGLTEIKPSLVLGTNSGEIRAGGMIINGYYYMPEQAATILNNYLSPGLSGKLSYQMLRKSSNLLNQFQLGLSAFHAGFTTADAVISKVALGVQKLSQGRILEGAKDITSSPISPITNFIKGNQLLKSYYGKNPELTSMVEDIVKAGGRVRMDSFYKNNAVEQWLKAWRSGNKLQGVIRTPGAAIEALAKPLMQELVPRQKLGVFFDLSKNINDEAIKHNWTPDETRAKLQEAWDSVDNRMGQLVYDNLFWNKSLKDLGMASVRSLGWNIGDIRELGGAPVDLARQLKGAATGQGFRVTPKMAYALSLPIVVGMIGGMTNYLYTGEAPKEIKDYYFPRTGKKLADGNDERISLPTYMKDVYAYAKEPVTTISNKLHPLISAMVDMFNNKDYYGYEIRNSGDPLVEQVKQEMEFLGKQFLPFSIRSAQMRKEAGESVGRQAQGFVGLNPAPKYITNTSLQTDIQELYKKRFGGNEKPHEQEETDKIKREIRGLIKQGNSTEARTKLEEYTADGKVSLTGRQTQSLFKTANVPFDVFAFKRLPQSDKDKLWEKMSDEEKQKFKKYYKPKSKRLSNILE